MTEDNATGTDYVLGTHDDEIARLGTQHQVWRAHMLDAWTRAGITRGSSLVDFGAGPGYATCDAAEIVGPEGRVIAVERSPAFLEFARRQIERRDLSWVSFIAADLIGDDLPLSGFDLAWCRWVASFVSSPAILLEKVAASLRVGGKAVGPDLARRGRRVAPRISGAGAKSRRGHDYAPRAGDHRRKKLTNS
jgi:ubiquinone/menaquinone biosynthesis C-methylase UbiE